MLAQQFITDYAAALATQQWQNVAPLIHTDACVTFSNGAVHKGIGAIEKAYTRNFALIKNEDYRIADVHWVMEHDTTAVYIFNFKWKGLINGQEANGAGRGTAVIVKHKDRWQLLVEHLGPALLP